MMYIVGCSNLGTGVVGPVSEEDFSVANVNIVLGKIGGIKKALANREDTLFIALGSGVMATGQLIRRDTVIISSGCSIQYKLKKGEKYGIGVIRECEFEFNLNTGDLDFTVPNVDSFDINVDAKAGVANLNLSFSIEIQMFAV
jgi:hypothetical protein